MLRACLHCSHNRSACQHAACTRAPVMLPMVASMNYLIDAFFPVRFALLQGSHVCNGCMSFGYSTCGHQHKVTGVAVHSAIPQEWPSTEWFQTLQS